MNYIKIIHLYIKTIFIIIIHKMKNQDFYILYIADSWFSWQSSRVQGVFSSLENCIKAMKSILKEDNYKLSENDKVLFLRNEQIYFGGKLNYSFHTQKCSLDSLL